jgi:hypothetical protein
MKEVISISMKDRMNLEAELYMGFTYSTPQGSDGYNTNYTLEPREEVNLMHDFNNRGH